MTNIYTKHGQIDETPRFVREDTTLIDFFVSDRQGYFEGVRFIEVGSEEWETIVEGLTRKLIELEFSPEQIEIKRRECEKHRVLVEGDEREITIGTTNIQGITYNLSLDGSPFRNFVSSSGLNVICNVLPDERRVDILPYNGEDGSSKRNFYYDAVKALDWGRFYCECDLTEALAGFKERGFSINRGRWVTFHDRRRDRELIEKDYILTGEYFTLDEIV